MNDKHNAWKHALVLACSVSALSGLLSQHASGQAPAPTVVDPNLAVRTVIAGLNQPTTMAFIGPNDIFVLEKPTGKVQRIRNGAIQGTVLDLAVNSASERGLRYSRHCPGSG